MSPRGEGGVAEWGGGGGPSIGAGESKKEAQLRAARDQKQGELAEAELARQERKASRDARRLEEKEKKGLRFVWDAVPTTLRGGGGVGAGDSRVQSPNLRSSLQPTNSSRRKHLREQGPGAANSRKKVKPGVATEAETRAGVPGGGAFSAAAVTIRRVGMETQEGTALRASEVLPAVLEGMAAVSGEVCMECTPAKGAKAGAVSPGGKRILVPSPHHESSPSRGCACAICREETPAADVGVVPCGHEFCMPCIWQWAETGEGQPACPLCKTRFEFITIRRGGDGAEEVVLVRPRGGRDELPLRDGNECVCMVCGGAHEEDLLLLCDSCPRGAAHTFCLQPPLAETPTGHWFCGRCVEGQER